LTTDEHSFQPCAVCNQPQSPPVAVTRPFTKGVDSHRRFSDKSLNSLIEQERLIKERNLLQRYSKQEQRNALKRRGDCAYQEAGFNTFGERLVQ